LWLNAGAPPVQIAARAGHSVTVLLTVYTHCVDGQDQITNRLIEHALRPANTALCPKSERFRELLPPL
jgi:trans-aconitate methyltransferase